MANFEPMMPGYQIMPGMLQAPLGEISGIEAPAEELGVDESLPIVERVYTDRIEEIVIPKFRWVGELGGAPGANNAGVMPKLTLASPFVTGPNPIGVASKDIYRQYPNTPKSLLAAYIKNRYIAFPFVAGEVGATTTYNSNLTGILQHGDFLAPDIFGRPVKYVPAMTITTSCKADANSDAVAEFASATNASLPFWGVEVVNITTGAAVLTKAGTTFTAAFADGMWKVTIADDGGDISQDDILVVTARYGHSDTKRMGQVGRIRTGVDPKSLAKWLRREVGNSATLQPMMNITHTVKLDAQVVTLNDAPAGWTVSRSTDGKIVTIAPPVTIRYITPTKPITVEYWQNPAANPATDYVALQNVETSSTRGYYTGTLQGPRFAINPVSGLITLYLFDAADGTDWSSLATSRVRVTFSYDASYNLGQQGFIDNPQQGIEGITDGSATGGLIGMLPNAAVHPDGAAIAASPTTCGVMNILVF